MVLINRRQLGAEPETIWPLYMEVLSFCDDRKAPADLKLCATLKVLDGRKIWERSGNGKISIFPSSLILLRLCVAIIPEKQ